MAAMRPPPGFSERLIPSYSLSASADPFHPPPASSLPVPHAPRAAPPYAPYCAGRHAPKMISGPFPRTLRLDAAGPNVALFSVPGHGHVYWGTSLTSGASPVRELDATLVRDERVYDAMTALVGSSAWYPHLARMWVINGTRLPPHFAAGGIGMPEEVARRLCVGFFDYDPDTVPVTECEEELERRVLRLRRVLREGGGKNIGVRKGDEGFRFSMKRVLSMLTCEVDMLATLICENYRVAQCFSGKVSYGFDVPEGYPGIRRGRGEIFMTEGMPVGKWIGGRFWDTGYGLVCRGENMYYSVVNEGEVSRFVRCRVGDIDYDLWRPRPARIGRIIE